MQPANAAAEWRAHPMLPVAAALGYATSVIHIYGFGAFQVPVAEDFGWDRATVTLGLTLATLIQAVFSIPLGMLVDRIGPRRIGLAGVTLSCAAYALIGLGANGEVWQWVALWVVMAFAVVLVQATIWTSAVASRFEASRGMALAVTLCGASVAQALFPWLGTHLIALHGWQMAIASTAAIWALVALPILALFFRGARDGGAARPAVAAAAQPPVAYEGFTLKQGFASTIYLRLLLASLLFSFVAVALVVSFVPIQTDAGMSPADAGKLAFWIGIFAIAGRLGTGFLLDRLRASLVGAAIFCLPILACLTMLYAGPDGALLAAALIGLTVGAEVDVIVYLATRHFGLKAFGALYGGLLMALSLGTALGPLVAARIYDASGSYADFFWAGVVLMALAVVTLASLPRPAFGRG